MIKASSPTRVDLAGGTIDCWPLFTFFENCQTVNLAIDVNTGVELEEDSSGPITLDISDLNYTKEFSSLKEALECKDEELTLVRPHLSYWKPEQGFRLKTWSKSPVGGGLGGSSSLCVSLLKAFSEWLKKPMTIETMVRAANNIETQILRGPGGTQDYFPPIAGGLNIIHYGIDGPKLEAVPQSLTELSEHLFVVYTGKAHHSGINNWQVIKAAVEGDQKTLQCLEKIAEIAIDMADVCRNQKWSQVPDLFQAEFMARTQLSSSFTSPEIEALQKLVLQAGGEAVKICGAGGGGCVVVWAAPDRHEGIKEQCRKNGFQPLDAKPVDALIKTDFNLKSPVG